MSRKYNPTKKLMDPREQQFQFLNICHRLHHFMKFLARNAHKMVISGRSMTQRLSQAPGLKEACSRSSQLLHPMGSETPPTEDEKAQSFSSNSEEKKEAEEEPRAPKKTVSINENVETIINTSDKKKGKKKKKKDQDLLDDSKPLKSILKVSSDVNNISDSPSSLLSRANGA